jgi:hypothetical protein
MLFGPVQWANPSTGLVHARLWGLTSVVGFISEDKKTFTDLSFNDLRLGGSPRFWESWRHRHGFMFVPEKGYFWSSLEDQKEKLEGADGEFYDRYLKAVWTFWTIKKLPRHLVSPAENELENSASENSPSPIIKEVRLTYDSQGLRKPLSIPLQINIWDQPVFIRFEVNPSTAPVTSITETNLRCRYSWTYNREDLRRLHGYTKNFWGYSWDKDFPKDVPISPDTGLKLDAWLDRAVAFWVDATAAQIMAELNLEIQTALAQK